MCQKNCSWSRTVLLASPRPPVASLAPGPVQETIQNPDLSTDVHPLPLPVPLHTCRLHWSTHTCSLRFSCSFHLSVLSVLHSTLSRSKGKQNYLTGPAHKKDAKLALAMELHTFSERSRKETQTPLRGDESNYRESWPGHELERRLGDAESQR